MGGKQGERGYERKGSVGGRKGERSYEKKAQWVEDREREATKKGSVGEKRVEERDGRRNENRTVQSYLVKKTRPLMSV